VFIARNLRLAASPRILKEKHVKLKLSCGEERPDQSSAEAMLGSPRCHPDSASIAGRNQNWRKSITHSALGWHMAERVQQEQLLPGDTLDIAFSLDQNDHPEFGGLELSLRDFKAQAKSTQNTETAQEMPRRAAAQQS
jgi:single-stranded-DNA-specific exonuclease